MDFVTGLLQSAVSGFIPMVVLLGVLIFIHEMGHFLVAKYFKVRVETFSLGFGPKLFKFKRGDTVYAISAIPLGGYVKMFGDDPTAEVSDEQKAYAFNHKPVGQRIAIVLAGPIMNLLLAIVLFTVFAALGEKALAPKLGDIETTSPAYAQGFRSGDTVVSAAGEPVKTWDQFQKKIEASGEETLPVVVQRAALEGTGKEETLQTQPKTGTNKSVLSWDRQVGDIDGLSYTSKAAMVGVRDPQSIAGKAGLQIGDNVLAVNGVKITKWREFEELFAKAATAGEAVKLDIERGLLDQAESKDPEFKTQNLSVSLAIPAEAKGKTVTEALASVGIEFPELFLAKIEEKSPANKAGLKRNDRLMKIDGQDVKSFDQVAGMIRSFGLANKEKDPKTTPLVMTVLRDGKEVVVNVLPNMRERMTDQGREEKRFEVGIRPMIIPAVPATIELVSANPLESVKRGVQLTWNWTSMTVLSFVRLFQNEVSPKNIGGFFSIGGMAKKAWAMGLSPFLNIMAIISINLFILNLLPVPVLDGGHLVFYTIEALRGAPVSMRKMEIAQQVGLVLLLGLMVFALFNDVSRWFN